MKIVMISNYINHHQIPLANALMNHPEVEYHFIQTEPMEEERIKMGWGIDVKTLPYVHLLYEQEAYCRKLIDNCEILMVGWMNREDLVTDRMKSGKLTFRCSERLYREGQYKMVSPRGLLQKYREHVQYRKKNVFLLCIGAYVASDYHLISAYPGKKFKFGYFTEFRSYQDGKLFDKKPSLDTLHFIWAGRFLPLKHPEFAMMLARDLKEKKISFHLHMVGDGEMKDSLLAMQSRYGLQDEVTFYGYCAPEKVRDLMERSHIHLFTSNYLEGWGAVVNESMNSGCVPVVNDEIGCARFLIQHGKNGYLYHNGSYNDLQKKVMCLIERKDRIPEYGRAAYETIANIWNAEKAAEQLIAFYQNFKQGKVNPPVEGPFSVAKVLKAPLRLDQKNARKL